MCRERSRTPADVLLGRIAARATNDYGKSLAQCQLVLAVIRGVEPLLRATCTHGIEATLPLADVVAQLVEIGAAR